MTSLKKLKNLIHPKFVLIKNLQLPCFSFDTVNDIYKGEVICIVDTLKEAQTHIPEFTFPSLPEKQELYMEIFEDGETMVAGDALEYIGSDLPWAIIDPDDCPYNSGKSVFGVTYTVVWVCPPNKNLILDNLIIQIQNLVKQNKSSFGNEIYYIWDQVLERMIFTHEPSDDDNLKYDIKEDLEKTINQLPNAPTQADWDYLEEMWSK